MITHVRKKFENEKIVLNGQTFIECIFLDCILIIEDIKEGPDSVLFVHNCHTKTSTKKGAGWPYELIELMSKEEPFTYNGPIGNPNTTKH